MACRAREVKVKGGQVAIFIIVAILIVAAILLFFMLLSKREPKIETPSVTEPGQYIEKCAKDSATEAVGIILKQGGSISPTNYKMYNNEKVEYLCYTPNFYTPCQNQHPLFISHIEKEIVGYISPPIDECFNKLREELEKKGYSAELGKMEVEAILNEGVVRIDIDRGLDLEINGEAKRYEDFKAVFNSPAYQLAKMAQEIANQEAKYCNAAYDGIMLLYPDFRIERKSIGKAENITKIYTLEDRYSGKKLNIAVRSCALPAGI